MAQQEVSSQQEKLLSKSSLSQLIECEPNKDIMLIENTSQNVLIYIVLFLL